MTYETLTVGISDKIATVALNRPDVRNAFNEQSINELTRAFSELGRNETVRAVVLAANGPAFCAGGDLNWIDRLPQPLEVRVAGVTNDVLEGVHELVCRRG